jgi:SAM-dependent methyltransferase
MVGLPQQQGRTGDLDEPTTPMKQQPGSATRQGELWGWRANDWAEFQEPREAPLFAEAIGLMNIGPGTVVLDIGCGAGVFCRLAADRGAQVSGLDAAARLIEIARLRVPEADLRVGDMQFLPYADASFDAICFFTSIQFAADRGAALTEARRVARPGASLGIFAWGPDERCELSVLMKAWQPLLPPPPAGAARPVPLCTPGVLEALVTAAGWTPARTGDLETVWEYPDESAVVRAILSSAGGCQAVSRAGEEAVRAATVNALAPFRTGTGQYRIRNEWHYLIASR